MGGILETYMLTRNTHTQKNGLGIVHKITSKYGWVVCIHMWEKSRPVENTTMAAHLMPLTTFIIEEPTWRIIKENIFPTKKK